ncbi:MAG: ATP-binding protein [Methylococcaceae bacterium]|nr:ATP-binding protein [Methylococcaceae bacterium]
MKIKELFIEDYKLLQKLTINFDSQLTVFIGKNGSGKSTVIEFIAKIFYDLYTHFVLGQGSKPDVDFKIRYEMEYEFVKYEVYITANKKTKEYYEVSIKKDGSNSKKYSKSQVKTEFVNGYKDVLPQNVVMYYSGISTILQDRFIQFQEHFISRSLEGDIKIEQPFFYFLPNNFSSILIGLLSYQYGDIPEILKTGFGISAFKEIKISIKKPHWAKTQSKVDAFWGAKGDLSTFLKTLNETCVDKVAKKIAKENSVDYIFTSQEELEKLWSFYGEEKSLFEYLTTLQANDFISDIDIILVKDDVEISFKRLSEGQKQVLTIFGLKELLITGNTLFLLDEPDTYLHPVWQRDFVTKLKLASDESKTNFIITTHSPQTLSNLHEQDVLIMDNGRVYSVDANGLFGRDTNAILEEVMDADDMSPQAHKYIEQINKDIALKSLDAALGNIEKLKEHLSEKDPFFAVAEMRIDRLQRKMQ